MNVFFLCFIFGCNNSNEKPKSPEVKGCGVHVSNYEKEVMRYTSEMKEAKVTEEKKQEFQKSFQYYKQLIHAEMEDGKLSAECIKKIKALTLQADLSAPFKKHDIKVRKSKTKK